MSLNDAWPSTVRGERAAIVPFVDSITTADWFDEAARAIAGRREPCRIERRLADGDQGWWIVADDEQVGALCARLGSSAATPESRAVIWTWLAVEARWRAYGYGGAAVPLLEHAARSAGATVALAPLPPDNGVALYFWLRLGYIPLRSVDVSADDWPSGVARDALWMQRSLHLDNLPAE
ncbi:MAG: hypothetical protein OXH13_09495 [Chloroflexi bacterium]|nr:hypothetical protein [Chloroflexota bacterium]MCY3697707.1 hypothetical protein [Chloroflexota bacterium]MYB21899.1 GNAT family N-acetyltransferase [Chloroflexota bacterium]MYF80197.1 GNAT family N-acetyltransferase [Chloroflexota bacterium]MYI04908.1 GNAT family N-acetyltransferase [Chloroflexota bacterium]